MRSCSSVSFKIFSVYSLDNYLSKDLNSYLGFRENLEGLKPPIIFLGGSMVARFRVLTESVLRDYKSGAECLLARLRDSLRLDLISKF